MGSDRGGSEPAPGTASREAFAGKEWVCQFQARKPSLEQSRPPHSEPLLILSPHVGLSKEAGLLRENAPSRGPSSELRDGQA